MDDGVSYYAILNVSREATDSEIRRAYRNLAQTFHPDKHTSETLRDKAADGFAQINEAYEVLKDPAKRRVYDIYGKQGLIAGLDVGSRLKTVEELKAEWEKFRAEREAGLSDVTHSTHLQCMVDCTSLLDAQAPVAMRRSEIESILIQSTLDKQLTPHHIAWIGGNVLRRGEDGGGNLLMGCRGVVDSKTGYSTEFQWGTPFAKLASLWSVAPGSKSEITFQTSRQLHENTQGAISTSYASASGLGLILSSTQILSETLRGTASLVVGPPQEAGVQLALSQRTDDVALSTKLQVGATYGVMARVNKVLTPTVSFRAVGRFGLSAIDADVGMVKKFSDHSTVSLSVVYGVQGTYLKARWLVGNYTVDIPIVFSRDPEDWKVALAVVTLTPLSFTLARHFILKPLIEAFTTRQERKKHAEQIKRQIKTAESAQNLQKSVAARMMEHEALKSGLVILKAEYGFLTKTHVLQKAPETNGGEDEVPSGVIDVTYAVQYLVSNSRLEMFPGVSKAGLMGFCDVAPNQNKTLRIEYIYKNRAYRAEVKDLDGLRLPQQGVLIRDLHEAQDLLEMARTAGYAASQEAGGSS